MSSLAIASPEKIGDVRYGWCEMEAPAADIEAVSVLVRGNAAG